VASDGCERLGTGGAGAVVLDITPGARRLYRFCARLDPGPGTMSSYRAETVGALLPMIACWTLRHVLPPGPVVAVADNAAPVSGVAALPARSSSSRHVWDEVDFWRRGVTDHFGSYAVEWQRGHPERHKPASQFLVRECCHHLADGLADLGRRGLGAADPSRAFEHASRWHVLHAGRRVFDGTRASVLAAIARADWIAYEASRQAPVLNLDQLAESPLLVAISLSSKELSLSSPSCSSSLHALAAAVGVI